MRAAVTLAILIGAYLIFEFGRLQANYNIVDAIAEQQEFLGEIDKLENRIVELKQEIALLLPSSGSSCSSLYVVATPSCAPSMLKSTSPLTLRSCCIT